MSRGAMQRIHVSARTAGLYSRLSEERCEAPAGSAGRGPQARTPPSGGLQYNGAHLLIVFNPAGFGMSGEPPAAIAQACVLPSPTSRPAIAWSFP